ncbi:LysR family transcriptional regulator [Pseudomonas sp. Bc-h]|uniref:helix-turn-helix domain-containing protein n=1 Tax=Pseudomonas sp. Bc-h TaxID=1943632 RepID=UPI001E604D4E|nr:LysR family transcriptional regulator [Pseudomonas sp. Bc-h]
MALKDLLTLRLYTRVVRLGSFSAAARESGLAQSQVSRMIAELEASLGTRLLSRTTRAVTPTRKLALSFWRGWSRFLQRWTMRKTACARPVSCAASCASACPRPWASGW